MLVLSRRPEEWIGIEISKEQAEAILKECGKIRIDLLLLNILRGKVRLGFTADERVAIHRQEIWDDIHIQAKSSPLAKEACHAP